MATDTKQILISVIIPVYNTPIYYVKRCVDSLMVRSSDNIEVILVDDGSTPEHSTCYQQLTQISNCIIYLHQENAGVSAARNLGIAACRGEYIAFVDADDEVTACFLEEALSLVNRYAADIIIGAIEFVPGGKVLQGNEETTYISADNILYMKRALLQLSQPLLKYPVLGTPCGRLYRRSCLEGICFPVGVTHWEDQIFNRAVMDVISSAVISPSSWYLYYQNDFSAMHRKLDKNYINMSIPFWQCWQQMNEKETDSQLRKDLQINSISYFFTAAHQELLLPSNACTWKQKRAMLDYVRSQPLFCDMLRNLKVRDCVSAKNKIRFFCIKWRMYKTIYVLLKLKQLLSQ